MTEDELQKLLETTLPARDRFDVFVEEFDGQDLRLRFSPAAGEGWTSAALLSVADTALRAAAGLSHAVSNLNVTVLRAAEAADVMAGLRKAGIGEIPVVVGGIIPPADAEALIKAGVARVYTPKDFDLTQIMRDVVGVVDAAWKDAA